MAAPAKAGLVSRVRHLGPYQLLRKIGTGGMAEVWSARRPASTTSSIGADKFVAIKVLAPHLAQKQQYRDMFLAEARLSMLLSHSNIVQVFDAIEEQDECYMVMELIEGMTLSQLERGLGKQGRKLPVDVSAYVVAELLRALAYAHEVKTPAGSTIVHRDVSPQNLMVTTSGEIKLMDFGIARFATEETQGAFVKGKLQYMPPEQLKKETRKPTIDLFAVGGILHELIDGRPFRAKVEETRLLGMVLQGEVPDLNCDLDEVPTELDLLRMWLLEPEEADRLQSANEALEQLYKWPGYHNAAIDLKKLVQEFVEPSSAFAIPEEILGEEGSFSGVPLPSELRSGPGASQTGAAASQTGAAASQTGAAVSQTGPAASQTDPAASQSDPAASQSGPAASQSASQTNPDASQSALSLSHPDPSASDSALTAQTVSDGSELTPREGEVISESEVVLGDDYDGAFLTSPPKWRVPAIAAAILLGLIGLGALLFGDREPAPAPNERPVAAAAAPASKSSASKQTKAEAKAKPDPDAETTGETTGEAEQGGERAGDDGKPAGDKPGEPEASKPKTSKPEADKPEPADKPRVPVEFVANEFFFVYVKVGSKIMTLEPRARASLPAGRHSVYLRQGKDGDWQYAGKITLSAGASYRVEMRKPSSLRLVKL